MSETSEGTAGQAENTNDTTTDTGNDSVAGAANTEGAASVASEGTGTNTQESATAPKPAGLFHLERVRELEEIAKDEVAEMIDHGIQAFKDIEGRTMRVVHRFGQLFKQEAPARAAEEN